MRLNDRKTKSRLSHDRLGAVSRLLTRVALLSGLLLLAAPIAPAQQQLPIAGSATDFNSVKYYGAPHQQEIELLFSGAQAEPIAGGLLLVKKAKLERFDLDGKLQLVAEAPECIYDPVNAVANSPGAVHVRYGDGNLTIDGEGFLWRQRESTFTISNQVDTVFEKMPALKR